ncbi:MAG: AzlD family protein [Haloplanus sp.]
MVVDLSPRTLLVIAAMCLVTYATKASGLWLLTRIDLSERQRAALSALPGGIIVAILAPRLAAGGPPEWAAGAAVILVAHRTDSVLLALAVGVGTVLLFRGQLPV